MGKGSDSCEYACVSLIPGLLRVLFIVRATNDAPPPCQAVWRGDETSGGGGGGGSQGYAYELNILLIIV